MKLVLIIRGLGGGQPVAKIHGRAAGSYVFTWDRSRNGHVREYNLPEDLKRLRHEAEDLLNQPLHWPIVVDVDAGEAGSAFDDLRAELEEARRQATEHSARITELEAQLSQLQGGESVSRQAHNPETEGSIPSPATTPPEAEGESEGEGEKGEEPADQPPTVPDIEESEPMTPSEAGAILGNGVPEPEDAQAAAVLATARKKTGGRRKRSE